MLPIMKKVERLEHETSDLLKDIKCMESILIRIKRGEASIKDLERFCLYGAWKEEYVLKEDIAVITELIRSVCFGQIQPEDALGKLEQAFKEIIIIKSGVLKIEEELRNCE